MVFHHLDSSQINSHHKSPQYKPGHLFYRIHLLLCDLEFHLQYLLLVTMVPYIIIYHHRYQAICYSSDSLVFSLVNQIPPFTFLVPQILFVSILFWPLCLPTFILLHLDQSSFLFQVYMKILQYQETTH